MRPCVVQRGSDTARQPLCGCCHRSGAACVWLSRRHAEPQREAPRPGSPLPGVAPGFQGAVLVLWKNQSLT